MKFADTIGQARDASVAPGPIACRQIVEYLNELVPLKLLGQRVHPVLIWKLAFDRTKPSLRCPGEPFEEVDLREQHGEVGGK